MPKTGYELQFTSLYLLNKQQRRTCSIGCCYYIPSVIHIMMGSRRTQLNSLATLLILLSLVNNGLNQETTEVEPIQPTPSPGPDATSAPTTASPGGSTTSSSGNRIVSIQDMNGKKTVSAAVVAGPANIGIPSFCFQRVDPGPCALDIVRVYYDYKTFTCKAFSYSGE